MIALEISFQVVFRNIISQHCLERNSKYYDLYISSMQFLRTHFIFSILVTTKFHFKRYKNSNFATFE